jgi:DNA-binding SARP family transcriptional activator/tetratricopeptide (TPR) repeat protein
VKHVEMADQLRFAVLGPLRGWRDDTELALGSPQQHAALAALLLREGRPVAVSQLVDAVWGTDPPRTAVQTLRTYISRLRSALRDSDDGSSIRGRLESVGEGYRVRINEDALDLTVFGRLVAAAETDRAAGDLDAAATHLRAALDLWHGVPLSGVPGPFAEQQRDRLGEIRLAALTSKLEIDLALGRHAGTTAELTALTSEYPLRERFRELLMLALYRSGRQADALTLYQETRRVLTTTLGIEPGPALQALHQRILTADPDLDWRPPRSTTSLHGQVPALAAADLAGLDAQPASVLGTDLRPERPAEAAARALLRPAQLPADITSFVGREDELASALLSDRGDRYPPVVISGMAGVGKTTLAVHWAEAVADRFPDGELYLNLRGFDADLPPLSSAKAMRDVIDSLGFPPNLVPSTADALASLYRSLFAGRRFLLVLDNALDAEQVRPLLPGAPGCLTIITSRNRLDGLLVAEDARFVALGLLTRAEGVEFLIRRVGKDRVLAELPAAEAIVDLCGRLPLALGLASARAVMRPTFPLASIAAELRESQGGLDAFTSCDSHTDMRSVFSWSYRALSPDAARLFRLLSLHPGPDLAVPAAASLAGVRPAEARRQIGELVEYHLLTAHLPGRFTWHDLLRTYAAELCHDQDDENVRAAARRRVFEHYLRSAHAADAVLAPHRDRETLPPAPADVFPQHLTDQREAADWLEQERPVLIATVEQAGADGEQSAMYCWQLAAELERFLDRHGRWQEQLQIQNTALDAARRAGDIRGRATALRALGLVNCRLGRYDDAFRYLFDALDLFRKVNDCSAQGRTHRYCAFVANAIGDHNRALDHYASASRCYAASGDRSGQAAVLNEIGWTYLLMGQYEQAIVQCEKAVAEHREIGDRSGEAAAWDSLGYAQHHLGRHEQALISYRNAVDIYRAINDRSLEADTLAHIGDTHYAQDDLLSAEDRWRQALMLYETLDHPDAEDVRRRLQRREAPTPAR